MPPKTTSKQAKLLRLPLSSLEFDEQNPRIIEKLPPKATQKQIHELLLHQMDARDLVPSFIANGFLPYEPLIVRQKKAGAKPTFEVIEGNRRLAALKSMGDSSDPEEKAVFQEKELNTPPCLLFVGDESQELAYLGLRHLSKTKDWDADAKAAFVERILKLNVSVQDAAKAINTTPSALRNMLLVRRLFERAGALGLNVSRSGAEGDITFWHLGDAIRRSNTKSYLKLIEATDPLEQPSLDETRFERLFSWLYGSNKTKQQPLIKTIRDIPELDQALGHEKATEVLEADGSIADALDSLQEVGARTTAHLNRAKSSVQKATGALSDLSQQGRAEVSVARDALKKATDAFDKAFN